MKQIFLVIALFFQGVIIFAQSTKAPAYPLVTHDPYFSIWSTTEELNASTTTHWSGANHSLLGSLKVDGKIYRFMGKQPVPYKTILPAADELFYETKYTENNTAKDWMSNNFDDSKWKTGKAPFSDNSTIAKTVWQSRDIWMRRTFTLSDLNFDEPLLKLQHDDDVEVYINGELFYEKGCCAGKYIYLPLTEKIKKSLKKGKNVLAIHVVNTGGAAILDAGIVEKAKPVAMPNTFSATQKNLRSMPHKLYMNLNVAKSTFSLHSLRHC